jgi:hypothetical protein
LYFLRVKSDEIEIGTVCTFHAGEGVPDFHLAAVAVHAHLELHRLELLPLLVPAPAAAAAQQIRQVLQRASHGLVASTFKQEGVEETNGYDDERSFCCS